MIKKILKSFFFQLQNIRYGTPKSCQIGLGRYIKNITCEGYNTIANGSLVLNCELGYASGVNKDSWISDTKIGRYTALAPGIKVIRGEHPTSGWASIHPSFYSTLKQYGFTYTDKQKFEEFRYADAEKKYAVIIGNDVWIGSNVSIIEGVTIGNGAIIAAGAVVTKDIPPYAFVGGVPAKLIRYRFSEEQIAFLEELQWWNKDRKWIEEHADYFENIEKLMEKIKSEEAKS